jgi:hypothetical protein
VIQTLPSWSGGFESLFYTLERVHQRPAALQRFARHRNRYAAERCNLDESIEELRQIADGSNDILAEAAGKIAGSWYSSPATHVGHELVGARMLILG